jgi:hypothetical protein
MLQDLVCTVCCEIPHINPLITPCHHVFCADCIRQSLLSDPPVCPNDRRPLRTRDLEPLSGLGRRMWEKIAVTCPNANDCSWKGAMGNYLSHADRCSSTSLGVTQRIQYLENQVNILEDEKENLLAQCEANEDVIEALRSENQILSRARAAATENANRLLKPAIKMAIDHTITAVTSIVTFDQSYSYDRSRVVELTQLICKYLEDKPGVIDSNRIYNCIKKCYDDLSRRYSDNPVHFGIDVRMLMNVCIASRWFTEKQITNFQQWQRDEWGGTSS